MRTLETKLGWPPDLAAYFEQQLRVHFPESWIDGHQQLISKVRNHPKDRHVLAAAAYARIPWIVTFNLRDFRHEDTSPWGVVAIHPDDFLVLLMRQNPVVVMATLRAQAARRRRGFEAFLEIMGKSAPQFVALALSIQSGRGSAL